MEGLLLLQRRSQVESNQSHNNFCTGNSFGSGARVFHRRDVGKLSLFLFITISWTSRPTPGGRECDLRTENRFDSDLLLRLLLGFDLHLTKKVRAVASLDFGTRGMDQKRSLRLVFTVMKAKSTHR